jgi:uncharacterized protein (DUF1015 family)
MANISPFRALLPAMSQIAMPESFFGAAKKKFPQYIQNGFYVQAQQEALYIYRIHRSHRSHTGVIACANVMDYIDGNIKKHENTITVKEDKMLGLFYERNAMIKPILLTYPNALEIDALINRLTISSKPDFTISFGEEEHFFWEVSAETQLHQLVSLFQKHVPTTYICDGHHRAASSERHYYDQRNNNFSHTGKEPYNFMLTAYFPVSEIEVHNYNRYVCNLPNTFDVFQTQIADFFTITPKSEPFSPTSRHQIAMYAKKQWFQLDFRIEAMPDPKKSSIKDRLDVELLNHLIFERVLGIADVRTEANIQYIEGVEGTIAMERAVNIAANAVGFVMYPVALEDLLAIANADGTMPPKSTWIEPRMRNGFLVQTY